MAVSPVPAAFTTVGTDVVIISGSGEFATAALIPAKIVKVTATQVTVEATGARTYTERFVASRWNSHYETQMDQYGTRDSWSRGASLVLATDESLDARRAAKRRHTAENALRSAAAQLSKLRNPSAEELDTMAAAMDAYRATLTPTE